MLLEPIYALDNLKRSYYLNYVMRMELSTFMKDLFGDMEGDLAKWNLWHSQAEEAHNFISCFYLDPLKKNRGKTLLSVEEVIQMASTITLKFQDAVPEEVQAQLEELSYSDYQFYQSCRIGKFWNEVPLPEIVRILFERFCQLVGANENGRFAVSVYDMSDSLIVFLKEKQVDMLIQKYDLEPFEKMWLRGGAWLC